MLKWTNMNVSIRWTFKYGRIRSETFMDVQKRKIWTSGVVLKLILFAKFILTSERERGLDAHERTNFLYSKFGFLQCNAIQSYICINTYIFKCWCLFVIYIWNFSLPYFTIGIKWCIKYYLQFIKKIKHYVGT